MKQLKSAARDNATPDAAYANLSAKIAELASAHELLLVSPLLPDEGDWFRMFAFASGAAVMTTLMVALGPVIPSAADQDLMMKHLRKRFEEVRAFDSKKAMALAAREAWPSPRADEFLASADTGPGFSDYSN